MPGVRYQQNHDAPDHSEGLPALLLINNPLEPTERSRIVEDAGCRLEAHAVLRLVEPILLDVPFKIQDTLSL